MKHLLVLCLLVVACGEPAAPLPTTPVGADGGPTTDSGQAVDAGQTVDGGRADAGAARDGGVGEVACTDGIADEPGLVKTTFGAYSGVDVGTGARVFRGIRFAAPPVDALRWAPPSDPMCEAAPVVADAFAPKCPQIDDDGAAVGDEDCLFLNVWTARAPTASPRPVMVFIHGGGNAQGSAIQGTADQILYDGTSLVEKHDIVVVTIQYRLGPLGWLSHASLEHGGGNYGTLDQIRALEWVRDNIAGFGGDPDRVTIFGESAGGRNVCVLVASPLAAGLFGGAIIQSGTCRVAPAADVFAATETQIVESGCDGATEPVECLRARSASQLLLDNPPVIDVAGISGSRLEPRVDGRIIVDQPEAVIAAGEHNHVAVIVGANADETSTSSPQIESVEAYEALVRATLGAAIGDLVLEVYPAADFATPRDAYVALSSDAKFVCGARRDARTFAAGQAEPVYRYFFTKNLSNAPRLRAFGAYHGIELFFVFDNLLLGNYRPSPVESALAETLGAYWAGLARGGDPNVGSAPVWPQYDAASDRTLILGDPIEVQEGIRTERCDFWDRLF